MFYLLSHGPSWIHPDTQPSFEAASRFELGSRASPQYILPGCFACNRGGTFFRAGNLTGKLDSYGWETNSKAVFIEEKVISLWDQVIFLSMRGSWTENKERILKNYKVIWEYHLLPPVLCKCYLYMQLAGLNDSNSENSHRMIPFWYWCICKEVLTSWTILRQRKKSIPNWLVSEI